MLRDITLKAQQREISGRKASRKLARKGLVPGVLYGGDRPPVTFQIDPRRLDAILLSGATSTTLFKFEVEGLEQPGITIIKDLQHDPLSGKVIHADLFRINMDQPLNVKIPIHLTGTAKGVKTQGGVLDFVCRAIDASCLPADIPERIDVDVTELELGDTLRVGELEIAKKVTLHTDENTPVATVVAPAAEKAKEAAEEEAEAEVAAEGAEPEVIKKGKAEGEGDEKESAPEKSE